MGSFLHLSLISVQRTRNRRSREMGPWFAAHRERVTRLLVSSRPSASGQLCVLGAGNCLDVDLAALTRVYRKIHLVDLDLEAIEYGLQRQSFAGHDQLCVVSPFDVSGWLAKPILPGACCDELRQAQPPWPNGLATGSMDVVASICLVSQLVEAAACSRPTASSETADEWACAARDQHLRLMHALLRPGGVGVLVTDFVSSETCSELLTMDHQQIPQAAQGWLKQGNCFSGLNPPALARRIGNHEFGEIATARVIVLKPWKWMLSDKKAFAVAGICFEKSSQPPADRRETR